MYLGKLIHFLIIMLFVLAGCSEDKNHKIYYPGPNGEKPADFVFSFQKDYKLSRTEALTFIKNVRDFADANSIAYSGERERLFW